MKIEFHSGIPTGLDVTIAGQRYRFIGEHPHTRLDGKRTTLAHWETRCCECGAWFITKSPKGIGPESKRCDQHKAPGRKATSCE